eukprot:1158167-Pelagomonas_calceolata.AAC.5
MGHAFGWVAYMGLTFNASADTWVSSECTLAVTQIIPSPLLFSNNGNSWLMHNPRCPLATIIGYSYFCELLGLDHQRANKLARKLHAHSVQFVHKLTSTKRATENKNTHHNTGSLEQRAAENPPDPH